MPPPPASPTRHPMLGTDWPVYFLGIFSLALGLFQLCLIGGAFDWPLKVLLLLDGSVRVTFALLRMAGAASADNPDAQTRARHLPMSLGEAIGWLLDRPLRQQAPETPRRWQQLLGLVFDAFLIGALAFGSINYRFLFLARLLYFLLALDLLRQLGHAWLLQRYPQPPPLLDSRPVEVPKGMALVGVFMLMLLVRGVLPAWSQGGRTRELVFSSVLLLVTVGLGLAFYPSTKHWLVRLGAKLD